VITNPPWNLAVDGAGTLRRGLDAWWRRVPFLLQPHGRFVGITEGDLLVLGPLSRDGLEVGLFTRVRVAGRVADVVLASPGGRAELPEGLRGWREHAIAAW
jgi:hypothetical protein